MISPAYMLKRMGALLREERLRRNETQRIFAARLGVHLSTLQRMEKGDPEVRIEAWVWLFHLMGIDLNLLELMTREEEPVDRQRATNKRNTRSVPIRP